MTQTTPTDYWSDTCNTDELAYALEHGAAGATTNPTIVHTVLKQQINGYVAHLDKRVFAISAHGFHRGEIKLCSKYK